ncbi:MAG TPA: hypothetical protein DCP03_12115 [Polaromonas sp.]|uniref:hypothetical protein n=1 Tax=Polaromonas sp. UBA4122 TaxID=1947074 RepID=UPI000EE6E13A|nr:hypothetical protein [Polaromonas sp. UBA4122]HAL38802.1 hypothetical protein [Polaromonas sp.]
MKKILSIAALSMLTLSGLLTAPAQAATAVQSPTFNVNIGLTSVCQISTLPTAAFTYTSFGAQATTASSFDVRCTNGLPITSIRLDDDAGGIATGLTQSYTDQATNLIYSLTLGSVPTAGSGFAQTVTLNGLMGASQGGNCAVAGGACTNSASTNKSRTLTITY